jgi:hypothetical protein
MAQSQFQSIFLEVTEVPVKRDELRFMADGECGEVGIHPDFGRGAWQPGQAVPKRFDFHRFGKHADVGQLDEYCDQTHGIEIGETLRTVGCEQRRSGGEAEKALLGGPAEARGILAGGGVK